MIYSYNGKSSFVKWNDHWSVMKPAYFIIGFLLTLILDFLWNDIPGPKRLYSTNMWSTSPAWKQYNKMAVLNFFFLVNSTQIYILFSLTSSSTRGLYFPKNLFPHSPSFRTNFSLEVIYGCAERNNLLWYYLAEFRKNNWLFE